jgi:hypothetical protein
MVEIKGVVIRDSAGYSISDLKDGWKMWWPAKDTCGITPSLALREAKHVLSMLDAAALTSKEAHADMFEKVKAMWNGKNFTLPMFSFAHLDELIPPLEIEPTQDGQNPPSCIHSIFVSAKEFCTANEVLKKSSASMRIVTDKLRGKLPGKPDKDGYYKIDLSAVQTPVALGHPLPPFSDHEFGIRANVEVQEDGTAKLLDGPVTFNPIQ